MDKEYRKKEKYYPILVSLIQDQIDTKEVFMQKQKKYKTLTSDKFEKIGSRRLIDFIYGIEQKYHLNDIQTEEFSRTVRQYFFGEVDEIGFSQRIENKCGIPQSDAQQLLSSINAIEPEIEEGLSGNVKITLKQAVKQYPQIKKQLITSKQILSKKIQKPLRPSVENWIRVYDKELGVGEHSVIERGNFIFRAPATNGLTQQERNILSVLLKTYDDNDEVMINSQTGKIVFVGKPSEGSKQKQKAVKKVKNPQIKKQLGKISFSSNHVMPAEKK